MCSSPVKMHDSLIINISGMIYSIERKDSIKTTSVSLGVARLSQSYPGSYDLPGVSLVRLVVVWSD